MRSGFVFWLGQEEDPEGEGGELLRHLLGGAVGEFREPLGDERQEAPGKKLGDNVDLPRGHGGVQAMIRCIDIEDLKARIQAAEDDKERIEKEQALLQEKADALLVERAQVEQELIRVSADLQASDLGSKEQQLEELNRTSLMLADNTRQWRKILQGLTRWEEDEVVTDYISNPVLNLIEKITKGPVTEEDCQDLHLKRFVCWQEN